MENIWWTEAQVWISLDIIKTHVMLTRQESSSLCNKAIQFCFLRISFQHYFYNKQQDDCDKAIEKFIHHKWPMSVEAGEAIWWLTLALLHHWKLVFYNTFLTIISVNYSAICLLAVAKPLYRVKTEVIFNVKIIHK